MTALHWRSWQRRYSVRVVFLLAASALLLWSRFGTPVGYLEALRRARDRSKAYVFYATQDMYACSVLVNVHILRNVLHTKHRIAVLVSRDVSPEMRLSLEAMNATVFEENPPPLHHDTHVPYYRDCLLKLMSFKIYELDSSLKKILVLDSDQLITQSLDETFDLDLASADFAAPPAYWIGARTISSTCMLIRPSPALWERVWPATASIGVQRYDMDIVNDLFQGQDQRLSGSYITLNSHWEDWNIPGWFKPENSTAPPPDPSRPVWLTTPQRASDQDLEALYREAKIVHFTAVGKPWMFDVQGLKNKRPGAHPLLIHQWERWRSIAKEICPLMLVNHV